MNEWNDFILEVPGLRGMSQIIKPSCLKDKYMLFTMCLQTVLWQGDTAVELSVLCGRNVIAVI
jgi:hypothetical protein